MGQTATRVARRSFIAGILLLASGVAQAQTPAEPPQPIQAQTEPPSPAPACNRRGRLHRLFHHSAHTLQDKMIGYPENFAEPPLGHFMNEQLAIQVAKADPHRFTLYRSDFLPGTSLFSPVGASRYNIMATRMPGWVGPITVEWTPEQPELAQVRRQAIVDILLKTGQPILADRVVVGPSPYPGEMGTEAANNFSNMVTRSQMSAPVFALPPTESASAGVR
jgi:hypothetical protein